LYEWDDADTAKAYAEGLARILRALSTRGSVDYELVEDSTVAEYLAAKQGRSAQSTRYEVTVRR